MNCTIRQAIGVWDELVDAYYDRNGFGGQTAEIYSYRLEEYRPSVHLHQFNVPEMFKEDATKIAVDAANTLLELIELFKEKYNCKITIDGLSISEFHKEIKKFDGMAHRYHVKIVSKE